MRFNRRRVLTGLLALLFGFGASIIAFRASDWATSHRASGTLLGALDFAAYCQLTHGPQARAVHDRIDAYGWECSFFVQRRYNLREINADQACAALYHGGTYAETYDSHSPYSWQCFEGPRR